MHSRVYIGIFLKTLLVPTALISCCNTPLSTQWCITWWKLKPQGEWTTHKNSPFQKALHAKKNKKHSTTASNNCSSLPWEISSPIQVEFFGWTYSSNCFSRQNTVSQHSTFTWRTISCNATESTGTSSWTSRPSGSGHLVMLWSYPRDWLVEDLFQDFNRFTLPETNIFAPEKRPKPNRKRSYSNHPFSGAKMLVSGRVEFLSSMQSLTLKVSLLQISMRRFQI